jgi:protein involved in polysaccharide export with SLBB domain
MFRHVLGLAAIALVVAGGRVYGQTEITQPALVSQFESRADLEAQARQAESQHRTSEAWLLRNRLEKGDFQEGDRIVVMLHSSAAIQKIDTLIVRAGKVLQLKDMDDLSLEGVLRSELNDQFVKHLAKYLRDPEARTTPLMRLSVQGQVGRPGFYDVSADLLLSDVVMRAGGPGGEADLSKIVIRRGPTLIWGEKDTQAALTDGLSLDRLHLRAGDEIEVGEKRKIAWLSILSVSIGLISLAVTLVRLR